MWFSVNLLFESVYSDETKENYWEEKIIILNCISEEEAIARAIDIGKNEEFEYTPVEGNESEKISVVFRKIERIFIIDDEIIKDGSEVFSRMLRDCEVRSILRPFDDS